MAEASTSNLDAHDRSHSSRRIGVVMAALSFAVLACAGGFYLWHKPSPLYLPAIDTDGMDPEVISAITGAQKESLGTDWPF